MPDEDRHPYLVVFGAAVRPDGTPSGTLSRRVEGAATLGRRLHGTRYIVTGGVGRHGPAEAVVMRDLLIGHGVEADRIVLEDQAHDTLSSIYRCKEILDGRADVGRVIVCSSPYHNPRCRLLFRMLGVPAEIDRMPADRPHLGTVKWLYYIVRELPAIAWDALLLLIDRARGRTP